MPNNKTTAGEDAEPRSAREDVALALGQIHGVVHMAVVTADDWASQSEPTAEDIRQAYIEVAPKFGHLQAALASGQYDEAIENVGLAKMQMKAKRKGLLSKIGKLFDSAGRRVADFMTRIRSALRWSNTLVGSVTAALQKELEHLPGAAAAGEAIKEFIELLLNASEEAAELPKRPKEGAQK